MTVDLRAGSVMAPDSSGFEGLGGSIIALSCTAACIYGALSLYGTIVLDLAPDNARAAYSGVVSAIGQVGSIAAPLVIGYLVSETGSFGSGFVFMGAALCIGAVCAMTLLWVRSSARLPASLPTSSAGA